MLGGLPDYEQWVDFKESYTYFIVSNSPANGWGTDENFIDKSISNKPFKQHNLAIHIHGSTFNPLLITYVDSKEIRLLRAESTHLYVEIKNSNLKILLQKCRNDNIENKSSN